MAHERGKFDEARKGLGKATTKDGSADVALSYICKIYRIEAEARRKKMTGIQLLAERRDKARQIFAEFHHVPLKRRASEIRNPPRPRSFIT